MNAARATEACAPEAAWRDVPLLQRALEEQKPDVIFHGAGRASVGASVSDPHQDFEGSVLLFQRLLEAVRRSGMRPHIIFPSSAAVYGNRGGVLHESLPPAPISPYGFHKWQCEILAREYAHCYNIPVTIVRLFSVFGVKQRRLVVWEMFEQARAQGGIHLRGTGREVRDYLPVHVLADCIARLPRPESIRVLNVASGRGMRIMDVAERIRDHVGGQVTVEAAGTPIAGDPESLVADVTELRRVLGDIPAFSFDAALAACCEEWSENA